MVNEVGTPEQHAQVMSCPLAVGGLLEIGPELRRKITRRFRPITISSIPAVPMSQKKRLHPA